MDHGRVVESGEPDQVFEAPGTQRLQHFLSQVL
jgi:polar amino acid transport system ATP-binding protein